MLNRKINHMGMAMNFHSYENQQPMTSCMSTFGLATSERSFLLDLAMSDDDISLKQITDTTDNFESAVNENVSDEETIDVDTVEIEKPVEKRSQRTAPIKNQTIETLRQIATQSKKRKLNTKPKRG